MRFPAISQALLNSKEKLYSHFESINKKTKSKPQCMSIIRYGFPGYQILEENCKRIKNIDNQLNVYIESLKMTAAFNNLVSLSCPQVGFSLSLFVMLKSFKGITKFTTEKNLYPTSYKAIINPRILATAEMKDYSWETCGSFQRMKARIIRPISLTVDYYNEKFELESETLEGFDAKVFQHELDHLEGRNIMNLEKNNMDILVQENLEEENNGITEEDMKYFENLKKVFKFAKEEEMKKGRNIDIDFLNEDKIIKKEEKNEKKKGELRRNKDSKQKNENSHKTKIS